MASEDRSSAHSIINRLFERPIKFDFFHALRSIECAYPDRPRIGTSLNIGEDPIRFCQKPSLAFATSTLDSFEPGKDGGPPLLFLNFMGMLGPNGPLPIHLTEFAKERILHHHDPTFAKFLDIFNHRAISLFYRAWSINNMAVSYDRKERDRFSLYLRSLIGIGTKSLQHRDEVSDTSKLHFSGHLICQSQHAEGLRAILMTYFKIDTDIEQFVGKWITLPAKYRCRLGKTLETGKLGASIVVGSRFYDCQQTFRVKMGPMSLNAYERMLPDGDSFKRLSAWIKNYTGGIFSWDAQLILKAEEVPHILLGQVGRLGWSTWVYGQPFKQDVGDLVLTPPAA